MTDPRWLDEREFRAWLGYRRMRLLLDAQIARDLTRDSGLSDPDYDVLSTLSSSPDRRWRLNALAAHMLWSKSRLSATSAGWRSAAWSPVRTVPRTREVRSSSSPTAACAPSRRRRPTTSKSVRRHLIDVLTGEQIEVLGDIADTVLRRLVEEPGTEKAEVIGTAAGPTAGTDPARLAGEEEEH